MNAQAILDKIEQEAQKAASDILGDASTRAALINLQSELKTTHMRADMEALAVTEGDELEKRMVRMEELEERKALLAAKQAIMDRVFLLALQKMEAMPCHDATAFISKKVLSVCEGTEEIIVGSNHAEWFSQQWIDTLNQALEQSGRIGKLRMSNRTYNNVTGVYLHRSETQIDCTYEAFLDAWRSKMESEVAKMLFS